MDACREAKAVPQTVQAFGVWNTGKVILKPRIDSGFFQCRYFFFGNKVPGGFSSKFTLQWRNFYVTKMPADYCN